MPTPKSEEFVSITLVPGGQIKLKSAAPDPVVVSTDVYEDATQVVFEEPVGGNVLLRFLPAVKLRVKRSFGIATDETSGGGGGAAFVLGQSSAGGGGSVILYTGNAPNGGTGGSLLLNFGTAPGGTNGTIKVDGEPALSQDIAMPGGTLNVRHGLIVGWTPNA